MLPYDDTDYCDTTDEQAKNPRTKEFFAEIANGDEDAFRFMWKLWCFSHVYDDMVDRDKKVTVEQAAKAAAELTQELSTNPFYVNNTALLLPHVIGAFARWADGEEWARSGDRRMELESHVVKCGDVDLYLAVAYVTGGWGHMRRCRDARWYDPDQFIQEEMC